MGIYSFAEPLLMLRILPLVAFMLVSAGVFAPQSVHGSCGDWLAHPEPAQLTQTQPTKDEEPLRSRPCDGPLCQQSPSGTVPMPSVPTVERVHHEAAFVRGRGDSFSQIKTFDYPEYRFRITIGHEMGIERPPKA